MLFACSEFQASSYVVMLSSDSGLDEYVVFVGLILLVTMVLHLFHCVDVSHVFYLTKLQPLVVSWSVCANGPTLCLRLRWDHAKCLWQSDFLLLCTSILASLTQFLSLLAARTLWVLAWLCIWGEVQICIWPSWCHCNTLSLNPVNPDWFYLSGTGSTR